MALGSDKVARGRHRVVAATTYGRLLSQDRNADFGFLPASDPAHSAAPYQRQRHTFCEADIE